VLPLSAETSTLVNRKVQIDKLLFPTLGLVRLLLLCSTSQRVASELKRGGWEGGGGERGEKVQRVDLFHHIIVQLTKVTLSLQALLL
jgi:hypothetical protein